MRVGILVDQFPVVSQTFVLNHAAGLLARGHDVVVVTVQPRRESDEQPTPGFARVIARTTALPSAPSGRRAQRLAQSAALALRDVARHRGRALRFALRRDDFPLQAKGPRLMLASRLQRASFDVLHAHFGPMGVHALELRAAGVFDAPVVCSFHGYDANVVAAQRPGFYAPLTAASRVTVATGFMRDVVTRLGIPGADISVWPQGVDTEHFRPRAVPHDGFRMLSVARLVDFKGVDVSLRAIALARPAIPGLSYTIIGDGERRAELEALAAQLGIDDITEFRGAQSHEAVRVAMSEADAFGLAGRVDVDGHVEAQGLAPAEASATGLPVVATSLGGLREVVLDEETGILVAPEDPDAFAAALVRLARDRGLRQRLGSAGRAHVERSFSLRHSIDVIERVYAEVTRNY